MLRTLARTLEPLKRNFHSSPLAAKKIDDNGLPVCARWTNRNMRVHSPEEPVTPYVYSARTQIHCSWKKILPVTWLIRGLSIDDAITQMEFDNRKVCKDVKAALEDARKLALTEHNAEFASDLWVAESRVSCGVSVTGLRRHSKSRYGHVKYRYCHFLVCLREGKPPKYYYAPPLTAEQKIKLFKKELDDRYVTYSI